MICHLDQVYTGRMMQVLSRHQDNTAHVLATNARQDHRAEQEQEQHNRMLGDVLVGYYKCDKVN